jgi:putative transposase
MMSQSVVPYFSAMPRTARAAVGGICYHVINCGNARGEVFHKPEDYASFCHLLQEAADRVRMRVLAYCLMPNHFHLALWPRQDGDLSRFMQWLLTAHVRRYLRA